MGRETKVFSLDVAAGQHLYFDNQNVAGIPATFLLVSPSGVSRSLNPAVDSSPFAFPGLQFPETGKYFVLASSQSVAPIDFRFRFLDLDAAPILSFGTSVEGSLDNGRETFVYRLPGVAGQRIYVDTTEAVNRAVIKIFEPGRCGRASSAGRSPTAP